METLFQNRSAILREARTTDWVPDHEFSVFNQMDHSFYDKHREEFVFKYRVFRAIAKVLKPATLTELGACAGSGFDAYNAGADPLKFYSGYDFFSVVKHEDDGEDWDIYERAKLVLKKRGVEHKLIKADLRSLASIEGADLVCIDAGHLYRDAYRDMKLAFESRPKPKHIFVDDFDGDVRLAFDDIQRDYIDNVADVVELPYYCGGGLVVEVK